MNFYEAWQELIKGKNIQPKNRRDVYYSLDYLPVADPLQDSSGSQLRYGHNLYANYRRGYDFYEMEIILQTDELDSFMDTDWIIFEKKK